LKALTAFLTRVTHRVRGHRFSSGLSNQSVGVIERILVEDSPVQILPKANAATLPAHGNRHGGTAGVKFDFAGHLLGGEMASHGIRGEVFDN
jgi:hypothetical protein